MLLAGCAVNGLQAGADAAGKCRVVRQAEMPIVIRQNELLVPARIGGVPVMMVLDTGAEHTMLTASAASRFGLPRIAGRSITVVGSAGNVLAPVAILRRMEFGGYEFPASQVAVAELPTAAPTDPPTAGLIGDEILSSFDLDFDFPNRRLTLYNVQGCADGFLPWQGPYATVPLLHTGNRRFLLPVEVEGHRVNAVFDTGANGSRLTRRAALDAGVADATLDHDRAGTGRGVGGLAYQGVLHRFSRVVIGNDAFRDTTISVVDLPLTEGGMLLGLDYMRSRRIWLSYATRQAFIANRAPVPSAITGVVAPPTAETP